MKGCISIYCPPPAWISEEMEKVKIEAAVCYPVFGFDERELRYLLFMLYVESMVAIELNIEGISDQILSVSVERLPSIMKNAWRKIGRAWIDTLVQSAQGASLDISPQKEAFKGNGVSCELTVDLRTSQIEVTKLWVSQGLGDDNNDIALTPTLQSKEFAPFIRERLK